mmetsp:Transcript_2313/g.5117  ORF Transcript_2313/g.5117 Transcript_2313/m.5117 type:complete len:105 (-) Transcript_2313:41-355(-)
MATEAGASRAGLFDALAEAQKQRRVQERPNAQSVAVGHSLNEAEGLLSSVLENYERLLRSSGPEISKVSDAIQQSYSQQVFTSAIVQDLERLVQLGAEFDGPDA